MKIRIWCMSVALIAGTSACAMQKSEQKISAKTKEAKSVAVRGNMRVGIQHNDWKVMLRSLQERALNPNNPLPRGDAFLHIAARGTDLGEPLILLSNLPGINVNIQNPYTKETPLITAIKTGNPLSALYLLYKGANLGIADNMGFLPRDYAVQHLLPDDSVKNQKAKQRADELKSMQLKALLLQFPVFTKCYFESIKLKYTPPSFEQEKKKADAWAQAQLATIQLPSHK